jgi:D-alanyl-D-alanine carboxypeptidase
MWSRRLFWVLLCFTMPLAAGPYSALVVEPESERVLYEQNADEIRHPASLTKMMTLYLVFEALSRGEVSPQQTFYASRYSASRAPSRIGLKPGDPLTVEEGILALVTCSANDAAVTLAEGLAGSEAAFAFHMTRKAQELGMTHTVFRNASGLPDSEQVTTAWDMYRLAKALLKHFPQYYPYFSTQRFQYRGRSFPNHNHLLKDFYGADGIKTGFINASGFNLVASARRNGIRLIGVVFGGSSAGRRDAHMRAILEDGFAQLDGHEPSIRFAGFDQAVPPRLLSRPLERREVHLRSSHRTSRGAGVFPKVRRMQGDGIERVSGKARHPVAKGRTVSKRWASAKGSRSCVPSRGSHGKCPKISQRK